MAQKDEIITTLYAVIDETNRELPAKQQLARSSDTVLFGRDGRLDSLGLVNFVVAAEQRIQEQFGVAVALADERAMSQKNSPFRTVGTLAEYIDVLLNETRGQ